MNGEGPLRGPDEGHRIRDPVAPQHGHLPLVQPRKAFGMQSREPVERRLRPASGFPSPGHHEYVSRPDPDILGFFGRFQIAHGHQLAAVVELAAAGDVRTWSKTPRPTTPSAIDRMVLDLAPSLRTSLAGRPPNISPRTNMCERASTWVVVSP